MRNKSLNKCILIILLILLNAAAGFTLDNYSLSIHIEVSELKESKSPMFIDNHILFTYYPGDTYIRRVAAAFASDDYKKVYPFMKNENNVFFMVRDIPIGTDQLNYRLIIDGVWTHDPVNRSSFLSSENLRISYLTIPPEIREEPETPLINNGRNVKFVYRDQSNKNVFLTGNFNDWDPFMLKMTESSDSPGIYTISLRLPPGKHFYNFVADGNAVQDTNNPHEAFDTRGNTVSVIELN